jgi:hypothetical protein
MFINDNPVFIEGNNFKGYIFPKEYKSIYYSQNEYSSYTPSKEEIINAETVLKRKLKEINKFKINQDNKCPIIHKQLCKYNRQYFGILDKNGKKVVFINFIWEKSTPNNWDKEIIMVLDGCSYYWNIKVNITDSLLYDLNINGMG